MRAWVALLAVSVAAAATAGAQARDVAPSIVNGYNAPRNRYPWVASLRYDDGNGNEHFCGASLVHPQVVMTAASCVVNVFTGKKYGKETFLPLVRVGGYFRTTDQPDDYQLRKVVHTAVYPRFVTGYVNEMFDGDLALMLLDAPVTLRQIRLPPFTPKPKMVVQAGTKLVAVGWGYTSPDSPDSVPPSDAERLQQIDMTLLSLQQCQTVWGKDELIDDATGDFITIYSNFKTNAMLCDKFSSGIPPLGGTCTGDGGGAHFVKGANAKEDLLVGVDSFGPAYCGASAGVVTNVAALRPWIDATIANMTTWVGRVWGDPRVNGFDGSDFYTKLPAGSWLNVISSKAPLKIMKLRALLGKDPLGRTQYTVMTQIEFTWGAHVVLDLVKGRTRVIVNGKRLEPGRKVAVKGGVVRFRENKPNWSEAIVIEQPGMAVRINRVWSRRSGGVLLPWFDLYVFLTRTPRWPLGGVLGRTFPKGHTKASQPLDKSVQGSLVTPPIQ